MSKQLRKATGENKGGEGKGMIPVCSSLLPRKGLFSF